MANKAKFVPDYNACPGDLYLTQMYLTAQRSTTDDDVDVDPDIHDLSDVDALASSVLMHLIS
jgi:hypothetical protein